MQTRDAVEAMMAIMKNEELYGRPDMPVWIERTAVGSSVQALIQCLTQLDIKGELAGRVLTRMAEVLEGRHSDEEIASADVMQVRDFSGDSHDRSKLRIAQHSLFVQVGRNTGRRPKFVRCSALLKNCASYFFFRSTALTSFCGTCCCILSSRQPIMHPPAFQRECSRGRRSSGTRSSTLKRIGNRTRARAPTTVRPLTNCRLNNGMAGGPGHGWHRGSDYGPARH